MSLGLSVTPVWHRIGENEVWRIVATDAKGERWVASDPDYYRAAVMLAVLVGATSL